MNWMTAAIMTMLNNAKKSSLACYVPLNQIISKHAPSLIQTTLFCNKVRCHTLRRPCLAPPKPTGPSRTRLVQFRPAPESLLRYVGGRTHGVTGPREVTDTSVSTTGSWDFRLLGRIAQHLALGQIWFSPRPSTRSQNRRLWTLSLADPLWRRCEHFRPNR